MRPGQVVVLNGTSSSGKSSIARALQDTLDDPFVHLLIEEFLPRLPARYLSGEHPDGVHLVEALDGGRYVTAGPVAERAVEAFYASAAAVASCGIGVIVDTLMGDPFDAAACVRALDGLDVLMVGVHCPLPILEHRERARGDRTPGLAKGELTRVHLYALYDLEVDTSERSPQQCAERIIDVLRAGQGGNAISRMRAQSADAR